MSAGRRARRVAGREGFTLLEMVVALAILSAIATFIAVTFRLAGQSMTRGEEEAIGMARLRAGVEVVERAVRSADPLAVLAADGTRVPYFLGERGRLRLLTAVAPLSVSGGGFRLLCLRGADPPLAAAGLLLSEASPLRAEGVEGWDGGNAPRLLVQGASEVVFRYSPGPTEDGAWEWLPEWDAREKRGLPAAVRLEFVTQSEGGPRRTALVVPIPAGGS